MRLRTIAPPPGLPKSVRYYVTLRPCGAPRPASTVARDAANRIVARFPAPFMHSR
jgi:hypothetical protein